MKHLLRSCNTGANENYGKKRADIKKFVARLLLEMDLVKNKHIQLVTWSVFAGALDSLRRPSSVDSLLIFKNIYF